MGPGPSNPDPRVLAAMSKPLVGHLDPYFVELMDQTMGMLRTAFRTTNHHTLPISATGSAGLETIMMNVIEPGDPVIVCVTGYFGRRLVELATRAGGDVRVLAAEPGEIVDVAELEKALKSKPAKLVAFVHLETTTGACQPIEPMVKTAHAHGALVMMDCVTSFGGMPIDIDALGIDAAGSCTQKCLGAPPALAPITIGANAMKKVMARKKPPATWYFDLQLLFQYWGEGGEKKRAFHHTAPISSIYGINEALRLILEEGIEARWARHLEAHRHLVRGLDKLGIELFTPAKNRAPTINVVRVPSGVDDAKVRARLLEKGVEMGGGLGPLAGNVWRIGVMGYNARPDRIDRFLSVLGDALRA
jgi:alanine-glyoxylate transaminase/serine-glyoxylate transaminase/serine-pyruvate transaminase